MKTIKLYYYTVDTHGATPPLERTLEQLQTESFESRLKVCGRQSVRLEDIERKTDARTGKLYWVVRFSRFRDDNWPGVARADAAATDLELDDDQILSEETSALFCPETQRLVVQYNHFGVRASKIQEYVSVSSRTSGGSYLFTPVLATEALEKYRRKQIVTSIDAMIDGVTEADIALFQGAGVASALEKSVQARATRARFAFSVDARVKSNSMDRGFVQRLVETITSRAGDDDRLLVTAKEQEDDTVEVIDLLEARKVSEYNADHIERTAGRRYSPTHLYALLEQAYREWQ